MALRAPPLAAGAGAAARGECTASELPRSSSSPGQSASAPETRRGFVGAGGDDGQRQGQPRRHAALCADPAHHPLVGEPLGGESVGASGLVWVPWVWGGPRGRAGLVAARAVPGRRPSCPLLDGILGAQRALQHTAGEGEAVPPLSCVGRSPLRPLSCPLSRLCRGCGGWPWWRWQP